MGGRRTALLLRLGLYTRQRHRPPGPLAAVRSFPPSCTPSAFVHFFVIFFLPHVSTSLHLFLPFLMRSLRPSHCGGEGEDGGDAGDDVGGGPAHVPTQPLARQSVVFMRSPLAAVMRQAMWSLKSMSAAGSSAAGYMAESVIGGRRQSGENKGVRDCRNAASSVRARAGCASGVALRARECTSLVRGGPRAD